MTLACLFSSLINILNKCSAILLLCFVPVSCVLCVHVVLPEE